MEGRKIALPGMPEMRVSAPDPNTIAILKALAIQTLIMDATFRVACLKQDPEEVCRTLGLQVPGFNKPLPVEEVGEEGASA